jgi:putative peptidoglycan lipid II flippase
MSTQMLRSARLISALTLVSRILGLARDMAITNALGVGSAASAFWMAFQVPNLFRRLFGEGALSAASIPVLTGVLLKEGQEATDRLAGRIMGLLLVLLTTVCILGEVVVALLFWGYGSDRENALALGLAGLMMPYLVFICAAAMLGGVQNVFGRFASPAAAPVILNAFMISAVLGSRWLGPSEARTVVLLAAAVLISGIFQMAWQWTATRRLGLRLPLGGGCPATRGGGRFACFLPGGGRLARLLSPGHPIRVPASEAARPEPTLDSQNEALRRIGLTMLPMIAGLATIQINTLADSLIAWWFVPEVLIHPGGAAEKVAPAVLSLAQRLYQFPLGIFATALATAIFPALSKHAAESDLPGLGRTLSRGIRVTSFEGLPSLVGLILIREPLVKLLFGHGEFQEWPAAAPRVSFALLMYALGIWAFGVNQILVRAYYALGDPKTPMLVSVRNVALNLVLNLVLVQTVLKEAGLALATSICAVLQVLALLHRFSNRVGHIEWAATGRSIARTAVATAVMAGAVLGAEHLLGPSARPSLAVAVLVAVGAAAFVGTAVALRCEELHEIARR